MRTDEALKARVTAYLEHQELERVRRYLATGRPHQRLSDAELTACWCDAFAAMAADIGSLPLQRHEDDLQAEFTIRRLVPPFDAVARHVQALVEASRALAESWAADPQRRRAVGAAMLRDLAEHECALAAERVRPN